MGGIIIKNVIIFSSATIFLLPPHQQLVNAGAGCDNNKNKENMRFRPSTDDDYTPVQIYVVGEDHNEQDNHKQLVGLAEQGKINLFSERTFLSFSAREYAKVHSSFTEKVKKEFRLMEEGKIFFLENLLVSALKFNWIHFTVLWYELLFYPEFEKVLKEKMSEINISDKCKLDLELLFQHKLVNDMLDCDEIGYATIKTLIKADEQLSALFKKHKTKIEPFKSGDNQVDLRDSVFCSRFRHIYEYNKKQTAHLPTFWIVGDAHVKDGVKNIEAISKCLKCVNLKMHTTTFFKNTYDNKKEQKIFNDLIQKIGGEKENFINQWDYPEGENYYSPVKEYPCK